MNKLFNIRIQFAECTIPVLETFFESIKFFNDQFLDIVLEIFFWYDKDMLETQSKKTLINICKNNNVALHDSVIEHHKILVDVSTAKYDYRCQFKLYYHDSDSFINATFQLFVIIKAMLNKEIIKNENRINRKRTFYKKNKSKRTDMDDKKS